MEFQLRITLPSGWTDCSREFGGPVYVREASENPGALQVSHIRYKSGQRPDPSDSDLIELCRESTRNQDWEEQSSDYGACAFGRYGTLVCKGPAAEWAQIWYLSNGADFVLATHIIETAPDRAEIQEAAAIVLGIRARSKRSWFGHR